MAWAYNLTPDGLVRDEGAPARQQAGRSMEFVLLGLLVITVGFMAADNYLFDAQPKQTGPRITEDLSLPEGNTPSAEAHRSIVQILQNTVRFQTPGALQEAIDGLNDVLLTDPTSAAGWAALSTLQMQYAELVPDEAADELRRGAANAINELAVSGPDGPAVLIERASSQLLTDPAVEGDLVSDPVAAEGDLAIVLARYLDPVADAEALTGWLYILVGRVADGRVHLERARELKPTSDIVPARLAMALTIEGKFDLALQELDRGASLPNPDASLVPYRWWVVLEWADETELKRNPYYTGSAAGPLVDLLFSADPEAALRELREEWLGDVRDITAVNAAFVAAKLGDPDLALEFWKQAVDRFPRQILWFETFEQMRQLPDFGEFLSERGFADYWDASGTYGDFCELVGEDEIVCN